MNIIEAKEMTAEETQDGKVPKIKESRVQETPETVEIQEEKRKNQADYSINVLI